MVSRRTSTAAHAQKSHPSEERTRKPSRNVSFDIVEASPVNQRNGEASRDMDQTVSGSDSDSDAGITFTALPDAQPHQKEVSPIGPTAAEATLPWKREYIQPALPSTTLEHPVDIRLAECPSWATNLDYFPDSPHVHKKIIDDDKRDYVSAPWRSSDTEPEPTSCDLPPPWRTPSTETEPEPRPVQLSEIRDILDSGDARKPQSLDLHDKTSCESALPWRSPSAVDIVEPMISPSASQIFTPHGSVVVNGQSHHSDPIIPCHHVTATMDELVPHSLLPATFHHSNLTHEDEDDALQTLALHRRHPSFIRTRGHVFLERRPSVTLPIELNNQEDCSDRIHKWLQSSHPDSLAHPPDYVLDIQPGGVSDETAI